MTTTSSSRPRPRARITRPDPRRRWWRVGIGAAVAVAVLLAVYLAAGGGNDDDAAAPGDYAVGSPGVGAMAPDLALAATDGTTFRLSDQRGSSVLLYFQEGLGCQPCWDQIADLEQDPDALAAIGADRFVSITTDPLDLIQRKAADEGLATAVLSDPDLAVSRQYHANDYGMMGDSRDGHTFILVAPDGTIAWRADYGGAPNYTMYVPVDQLVNDHRAAAGR